MNDFLIDKRRMRRAFNRAAPDYDAAAVLQREVCVRMLERARLYKAAATAHSRCGSARAGERDSWRKNIRPHKYCAGYRTGMLKRTQPFRLVAEIVRRAAANASMRRHRILAIGRE